MSTQYLEENAPLTVEGIAALMAMPDELPFEPTPAAPVARSNGPAPATPDTDDCPATPATKPLPPALARAFLTAGRALFTVVSKSTGARFTFKISRPAPNPEREARYGRSTRRPLFIGVLSGPDNESSYSYLGTIWEDSEKFTYAHGRKSFVSADAPSARAALWLTKCLNNPALLEQAEVYHAGRCGRCGRTLTVPSSIEIGLGPECAGRM